VVRLGRLYPQSPYTARVNTLHVPSVESTLLRNFARGTNFVHTAPLIFQDTLKETVQYLEHGCHITADHSVGGFLERANIPTIQSPGNETTGWMIPSDHVMWRPRCYEYIKDKRAQDYKVVVALFFRVNGAYSLMSRMKSELFKGRMPASDANASKIIEFLNRHVPLMRKVDTLKFPSDKKLATANVPSGGPTTYIQDRDMITVRSRGVKLEYTPLEVLKYSGVIDNYELDEFAVPVHDALAQIAHNIRNVWHDETLIQLYVGAEDQEAFDFYYPIVMSSAEGCRAHSWYLACLTMINHAWQEIVAVDGDSSANESRGPTVDKHSMSVQYAFHRCMGSYTQLFYHALACNPPKISDDDWRPTPDGRPTPLDKYFPCDTVCFHAGDLPSLDMVLDQVGLYGIQVVKNKIPLVRVLMKSLPVCCQSRDLVKGFITECRSADSEGFWRVVRSMFFCTMAGLYPHAKNRIDFRSMLRVYGLLFHEKHVFLAALERERLEHEAKPKSQRSTTSSDNNKTCQFVYVAFREFFIHSVQNNSEWIALVSQRINWRDFVVNTVNMADQMRKYARFADAPKDNELLHAINALWRCKGDYNKDVYRYRKKSYEQTIIEKMNDAQDELNARKCLVADDIQMINELVDRLVRSEILSYDEIAHIYKNERIRAFGNLDPMTVYKDDTAQFTALMRQALAVSEEHHLHLSCVIDPQTKVNIMHFLLHTKPADRLRFDCLLDPRLGAVSREAVQIMYKTHHIYNTRSSPKSIETNVRNLCVRDLRIFSWYFNILLRLGDLDKTPIDASIVTRQARAIRKKRFHLLDHEPLPDSAWVVYVTICCGRIATFADTSTYGNLAMSYDVDTKNMVCSKKVARTARVRHKPPDPESMVESEAEKKKKADSAEKKKARAERKDENLLPCGGQPMLPINLYGSALVFGGERYLFCPECGQFHTYRDAGWGRGGYMCMGCRGKEVAPKKLQRCAYCERGDRGHDLIQVDVIALDSDPCNEHFDPVDDPLSRYQQLYFCQTDANSIGKFKKHPNDQLYNILPKDKLWKGISPANTERAIKNYKKHN